MTNMRDNWYKQGFLQTCAERVPTPWMLSPSIAHAPPCILHRLTSCHCYSQVQLSCSFTCCPLHNHRGDSVRSFHPSVAPTRRLPVPLLAQHFQHPLSGWHTPQLLGLPRRLSIASIPVGRQHWVGWNPAWGRLGRPQELAGTEHLGPEWERAGGDAAKRMDVVSGGREVVERTVCSYMCKADTNGVSAQHLILP